MLWFWPYRDLNFQGGPLGRVRMEASADDQEPDNSALLDKPSVAELSSETEPKEEAEEEPKKTAAPADKAKSGLKAKLSDYKETLTVIVFFLGGIGWVYANFASKVEVARMKCILGDNIQRVDNEAQSRFLQSQLVDESVTLVTLQRGPIQAQKIAQIEKQKLVVSDLLKKKSMADEIAKKASEAVGDCDK